MSKLDDLIKNLCPDGVEFKKLGEVCNTIKGMSGVSKKWSNEGNCRFIDYLNVYNSLSVDVKNLPFATVKNLNQDVLRKGDILFTLASEVPDECAIASAIESDIEDEIFLDDHLFGLRPKEKFQDKIVTGFLKHYFHTNEYRKSVSKAVRGVTRFYLSKPDFMKILIPLPPLEVQREIVRILDNFTELIAELTAELTARKKQYEFYRDLLLTFDDGKVEFKKLGEIAEITDYVANGSFADLKKNVRYLAEKNFAVLVRTVDFSNNFDDKKMIYIDEDSYNYLSKSKLYGGEIIINNIGAGVGSTFICPNLDIKMSLAPNAVLLRTNNNKFFYYCLSSTLGQNAIKKIVTKSSMPKFNKTSLRQIKIPVPPIEEQERIVKILDRFDKLCNDITEGLPAEISARQKQYEYYRDKLLTFDTQQNGRIGDNAIR